MVALPTPNSANESVPSARTPHGAEQTRHGTLHGHGVPPGPRAVPHRALESGLEPRTLRHSSNQANRKTTADSKRTHRARFTLDALQKRTGRAVTPRYSHEGQTGRGFKSAAGDATPRPNYPKAGLAVKRKQTSTRA